MMFLKNIFNYYLTLPIIYIFLSIYISFNLCNSGEKLKLLNNHCFYHIIYILLILFISNYDIKISLLLTIYYISSLNNNIIDIIKENKIFKDHNINIIGVNNDLNTDIINQNNNKLNNYIKKDKYFGLYDNLNSY